MATMLLKRCSHVYIRISGSINLNYLETNIKYVKCTAYYHEHCQRPRGDFVGLQQQSLLSRQPCRLTLINKNSRFISCFHSYGAHGSRNYTSDNQKQDAEKQRTTDGRTRLDQTRIKFKETTEKFKETTDRLKETTDKFKERLEETIMKENIFTVPNLLCVTRIVLSPYLGYLILQHSFEFALGLFVFAGVTDLLDGFIARNFKDQQSMFGSFLDPMADKFLVFCLFISLTYINLIPIPLTSLIIARDVCLFGAGFYIRYLSLPPPKTLWRYFDATHATAQLSPTTISKVNTAVQLSLVACTLAAPVFHLTSDIFFHTLWYLTAATTTLSGISYIFSKNSYHLLRKIKENRKN